MNDFRGEVIYFVRESVLVLAALFPIVNPLGSAAIFANLVGEVDENLQRLIVQKVTLYSLILLIGSMLWGVDVLSFFGISIYGVQIGGGLIVAVAGWTLLNREVSETKTNDGEGRDLIEHAFYPFTLPITVGPGSISVAITLGAHLISDSGGMTFLSPRVLVPGISGAIITCASIYVCYRYARRAERLLGKTGTIAVMRLSSFILLCIGVQIIGTGFRAYFETINHY